MTPCIQLIKICVSVSLLLSQLTENRGEEPVCPDTSCDLSKATSTHLGSNQNDQQGMGEAFIGAAISCHETESTQFSKSYVSNFSSSQGCATTHSQRRKSSPFLTWFLVLLIVLHLRENVNR